MRIGQKLVLLVVIAGAAASCGDVVRDSAVVINLVGILFERGQQRFHLIHTLGAETAARAASAHGARMIHVSAIGADVNSRSTYARTKAQGEKAVLTAAHGATIFRPSIMFGPEDDFFNKFASMARFAPALPLIGGGHTRFQPVFVDDVAEAIAILGCVAFFIHLPEPVMIVLGLAHLPSVRRTPL